MAALDDETLVKTLAGSVERWEKAAGGLESAVTALARDRGDAPAMLRFGFRRLVAAHDAAGLHAWLRSAQDESGGAGRGPALLVQVLAGNVPGLALPAILEALLARSAVIVKPAAEDRHTAPGFRAALTSEAPLLSRAVAVVSWRGGDRAAEDAAFSRADAIVASGGDAALDAIAERAPRTLLRHGPRISVGVVGEAWRDLPPEWWTAVSGEIALWDQKGCLSPLVLCVGGDRPAFAGRLAEAMAAREREWPAPPRPPGDAAAIHAYRARHAMGAETGVREPGDGAWTVVWDGAAGLDAGPPHRVVRVAPALAPRELVGLLRAPEAPEVQGIGLAALDPPDTEEWRAAGTAAGVGRVCPLHAIQDPPAGWRADGRSGLAELLRMER